MNSVERQDYQTILSGIETNPDLKEFLVSLVDKSSNFEAGEFLEIVDQSDYSIVDWTMALRRFDSWLSSNESEGRNFADMTGYIHCCEMMIANLSERPDLQGVLIQSLNEYGFDPDKRVEE